MSASGRVVLVGRSAWEYWRTNPLIRQYEIPESAASLPYPAGAEIPAGALASRKNANRAARVVSSRLRFDLKNLTLPIHLYADETPNNQATRLIAFHAYTSLPEDEIIAAGGSLFVASPALALAQLASRCTVFELAQLMFEACGIYALSPETHAARFTVDRFQQSGMFTQEETALREQHICEYYDDRNRPVRFTDPHGDELPWEPCFERSGRRTTLWKRPPLTTADQMRITLDSLSRVPNLDIARKAARWAIDGSGSPLESKWALMTGVEAYNGGEAWRNMMLNRRIVIPFELRDLAGQSRCIADQFLPDSNVVVEINGRGFHADRDGFIIHSGRRSALEALGFNVFDINYDQMRNLNSLDAIIETIARRTNIQPRKRTTAFLRKRHSLHAALFPSSR